MIFIEKIKHNNHLVLTDGLNKRVYIGYTKKEALRKFKREFYG